MTAMARSIADLSWDELDAFAQEAGAEAIEKTHAAGLPTYGHLGGSPVFFYPDQTTKKDSSLILADEGIPASFEILVEEMRQLGFSIIEDDEAPAKRSA